MRSEELFSRSGFYGFLLKSNVLLHREAVQAAIHALQPVVESQGRSTLRVLDLACGGWPVTIAEAMGAFPQSVFQYTGVDINPDQVVLASSRFPFPDNVVECRVLEGNAWDLESLDLKRRYSLVFSGMNLHHASPQEIGFLGRQLETRLRPGGLFFSHDVYRPDHEPYWPRPELIDGECAQLAPPARLAAAGVPSLSPGKQVDGLEPAWRVDYVQRMHRTLLERGGDQAGADSTVRHMRSRDYPLSTAEVRRIMKSRGFHAKVQRYDCSAEPLGPFVATCAFTRGE